MAPAAKDPSEILQILDTNGRRQVGALVENAIQQMRSQLRPRNRAPDRVVGCCGAATQALDAWRDDVVKRLRTLLGVSDFKPPAVDDLISFDPSESSSDKNLSQKPTSQRIIIITCLLLLLLASGAYSAHSRTLLLRITASLNLPETALIEQETAVASTLLETAKDMSADAEAAQRKQQNKTARMWKVGLASVAGAAVIGITGGLAAPVVAGAIGGIMGGVGLGGVASFLGVFWMNGALVGALFGAYGAKMTGERMDKYAREVQDFSFVPISDDHRLRVTIGINGWLTQAEDITRPWRSLPPETFALRYELAALESLGKSLTEFATSYAWGTARNELLRRTVLASVWGALWPAALLSGAASAVDNPFSHALNRSTKAGCILADALANRVQGERPVTLVGFSLGASVVCACLEELSRRRIFGVVETVVIIGAPAGAGSDYWAILSAVVSGGIYNVYSDRDALLGLLYRSHALKVGVAGLQPIANVEKVQNIDLSAEVSGHLRYPDLLPNILSRCGFSIPGGDAAIAKDDIIPPVSNESTTLVDFSVDSVPTMADLSLSKTTTPASRTVDPLGAGPVDPLGAGIVVNNNNTPDRPPAMARTMTSPHTMTRDPPPPLQRYHSSYENAHPNYDSDDSHDGHIKLVDNE